MQPPPPLFVQYYDLYNVKGMLFLDLTGEKRSSLEALTGTKIWGGGALCPMLHCHHTNDFALTEALV